MQKPSPDPVRPAAALQAVIPAPDAFPAAGRWIWCDGEEQPLNFYLHFRRSLICDSRPSRAEIAVTADSRYRLFVNGNPVAFGPARSDRRWLCLDRWDITAYLRPGPNVVAALVHHYGESTFSCMLGRAGFLAELTLVMDNGRTERIGTDNRWRVHPAEAWDRCMPRMSIQLGFAEVFDARKELTGWTLPEYDDEEWPYAVELGPPGMEPWPHLVPRNIPAMREVPVHPERVIATGTVGDAATGHFIDLHRIVWSTRFGVAYLRTQFWSPEEASLDLCAGSQESLILWLNGRAVICTEIRREAGPDQERVRVRLRAGWNTVLAKVVQDEAQWQFLFRLDGPGSERCVFARTPADRPPPVSDPDPWWLCGPFQADSMADGFRRAFPPEQGLEEEDRAGAAHDGTRWITAGVSDESKIIAVRMAREPRLTPMQPLIEDSAGLLGAGPPARFLPGAGHGVYAVIDFGREVAGYPVLSIEDAAGGEVIDIGYSEFLSAPDGTPLPAVEGTEGVVNCDRAAVHYADRYLCRPGSQRFQTFDKRAFRYLQVDVRGLQQPIRIGPVSLILSTYPVVYQGSFTCSDDLLNRIWDVGRWTVHLNMEDAYTDCPWRERGQWWGDARIQALVNYYAFGDRDLIRYGHRLVAWSQDAEGWTRGIYPTDFPYSVLPTFSLLWIVSLHDYVVHTGDRDLARELLPVMEGILAACARYRGEHGLLADMPHWVFVDWAGVETAGVSASVNALYHGALCAAAAIHRSIGGQDTASRLDGVAGAVHHGMMTLLWDGGRQCFRDGWRNGACSDAISEQANCWAVTFGVVEGETAGRVVHAITDGGHATVRTGSPYFAFYMLAMFARTGAHGPMLRFIREHWKPMLDRGATTWWETWEPKASHCHGWSAGPTYFLQSEILGVQPGLPGWAEVRIAPHPSGLTTARGSVPLPQGPVSVAWRCEPARFELSCTVPARFRIVLPPEAGGNVDIRRQGGGESVPAQRLPDEGGRPVFLLAEPGAYRVICS